MSQPPALEGLTTAELIKKFADKSWYTRKKAAEIVGARGADAFQALMDATRSENDDIKYWTYAGLARIGSEQAISFLLKELVGPDKTHKVFAGFALGEANDVRVTPALIASLNDESWSVCDAAAKSLAGRGEAVLNDLVEALKTANYNVAYWITKILSRMGTHGVRMLVTFLTFKNKNVRILVTEALSESKDTSVVPHLLECLRDENFSVQNNAADALVNIGEDVVEPLLTFVKDEPDIHHWVARIFERLGPKRVQPLIDLLHHPDRDIRMRAAEALGETRAESAIRPLIETLQDKVWLVRKSTAKGLAAIGEIAIDHLIRALKTEDENVRYWITTILGKIGDKTIDPLVRILQTGTREMKVLAARALGETRDERAVRALIEALKDDAWPVRSGAAASLKMLGGMTIFPLLKVIMAQNEDLRFWAQKIVADIGPMEVDQFLRILQNEENAEMRYLAAYGLSLIKSKTAIEPLTMALLNDTDDWVRRYAAAALSAIGDKRVVKPLLAAMESANEDLAAWIAKELGKMGREAVEPLLVAIQSKDERTRFYAMLALAETGAAEGVEALLKFLDSTGVTADQIIRVLGNAGESALPYLVEALKTENPNIWNNVYNILLKYDDCVDKINEYHEKSNHEKQKYWLGKALRDMKKPKIRLKK